MSTTTAVTPYGASKFVNAYFEENEIEKVLPPQMFYNYTTARVAKGKEPYIPVNEDGKIELTDLAEWLEKYIAKNVTPATAEETVEA